MEADILERILDGREKPTNLPFSLLRNITEHFSEDRVIGQGGFATVYKGVLPNARVAVKRIRNSHSIDEKLFYREVDSLLTINHQNVVRFLGFCASTEQTAIKLEGSRQHIYAEIRERLLCFEYMRNGSLQKHITDELRGFEWDTCYQIIKGICEGLHHLHKEKHIYHMDLKPANILLDNHMVPKITDFGLSRLDEKSQTMSGGRSGSFGYCAPEYLLSGKMSFKSDMFSLGVIITELVTGHKGIPDNNKNNVLRRWRHRWKKLGKETRLIYQQVAKCIEIGLFCQEIDPSKRPFIWDLIHDIREMEGVNGEINNACEYTFGQISPYSEDGMLGVEPIVLHFPFELNKQISCSLQLTNHTDAYIAFNILNMSPLPYCTQPNKDIVPPQSKCRVDITLQVQDKAPQDMRHADEFIVWSTKVDDGLAADDITTEMFSKESGVVDAVNLDVVFDAEGITKVNDGPTAEDITTSMFNKEICVVDKMPGIVWPNPYPVRGTSPQLPGALPSPARSMPRRFFKRPFPPPSLAKHIKTTLAKRLGGGKHKEVTIPEEGVVGAGASGNGVEVEMLLDKTFGFGKNFEAMYELRKKVRRGHFAEVYSAVVKKGEYEGQTVAVKIISKAKMKTDISIDDVRREVKILKALSGHNNLVKFYDACEDTFNVYMVMELCEGGELLDRILARGGRYTEEDAKAIVVQILSVVAFCHLQGVVHRDLKPENFLFTSRHENAPMKLIDFGFSDFIRPDNADQRCTDVVGSSYYIAPEVLHKSYSMEADIWSIGVITYVLLSGNRPFWARTESGVLRAIVKADPNLDDSPWPSLSAEAKDFVKRILNKDYRKRMTAVQALTHPWFWDDQKQIPLDFVIFRLIKQYFCATPLKRLVLKALCKALKDDELLYLRLQFKLLEPVDGVVTLDNFRMALTSYLIDAIKESKILEFLPASESLTCRSMDFEEFCAATISPYQLEALDRWEDIAGTAFQHFEQEGNRVISVEELAQELNLPPIYYSVVQYWIRETDAKLNFLGFTQFLLGVKIQHAYTDNIK